jgi:hypothetical protein
MFMEANNVLLRRTSTEELEQGSVIARTEHKSSMKGTVIKLNIVVHDLYHSI